MLWYTKGVQQLLERWKKAEVQTATGATVIATPDYTDDVNPSLLKVGMTISSAEFPVGTTVLTVVGAVVTMSANALATVVSPLSLVTGVLPAGIINDVTIHPFLGAQPQNADADFSQFAISTLAGVIAQVLTLAKAVLAGNDGVLISAQCIEWSPTDSLLSETITGVVYTLPGTPDPLPVASELLPAAKILATPDDLLKIIPVLSQTYTPGTQGLVQL